MFQKLIEFFQQLTYIIFEIILTPPLTPPEKMQHQFTQSYVLLANRVNSNFQLQGHFTNITTQQDEEMYSSFSTFQSQLGKCQATFLKVNANQQSLMITAHHCLDWWAFKNLFQSPPVIIIMMILIMIFINYYLKRRSLKEYLINICFVFVSCVYLIGIDEIRQKMLTPNFITLQSRYNGRSIGSCEKIMTYYTLDLAIISCDINVASYTHKQVEFYNESLITNPLQFNLNSSIIYIPAYIYHSVPQIQKQIIFDNEYPQNSPGVQQFTEQLANDLHDTKNVIFYGEYQKYYDRIETNAGVMAGMSGGPCIIRNENSEMRLVGIVLRTNYHNTQNVCIDINILLQQNSMQYQEEI